MDFNGLCTYMQASRLEQVKRMWDIYSGFVAESVKLKRGLESRARQDVKRPWPEQHRGSNYRLTTSRMHWLGTKQGALQRASLHFHTLSRLQGPSFSGRGLRPPLREPRGAWGAQGQGQVPKAEHSSADA